MLPTKLPAGSDETLGAEKLGFVDIRKKGSFQHL
jgi:hypothetical protein